MMKLSKSLIVLSLVVFLSACSDDENSPLSDGTWTAISFNSIINATSEVGPDVFVSTTEVEGSNMFYNLVINNSTFSTSGSYDVTIINKANGSVHSTQNYAYTDVSESGEFSIDYNMVLIKGSLFELKIAGVNLSTLDEKQAARLIINAKDELLISQDEMIFNNSSGINTEVRLIVNSLWQRK